MLLNSLKTGALDNPPLAAGRNHEVMRRHVVDRRPGPIPLRVVIAARRCQTICTLLSGWPQVDRGGWAGFAGVSGCPCGAVLRHYNEAAHFVLLRRFTLSVKLDHCSTRKARTSLTDGGNQGRSVRASMASIKLAISASGETKKAEQLK